MVLTKETLRKDSQDRPPRTTARYAHVRTAPGFYTGPTIVEDGWMQLNALNAPSQTLRGNLIVGDGIGALATALVTVTPGGQIVNTADITAAKQRITVICDGRRYAARERRGVHGRAVGRGHRVGAVDVLGGRGPEGVRRRPQQQRRGSDAPALGLAEGGIGGPHNFDTYILLANPSASEAKVTVTYLAGRRLADRQG